MKIITGVLGGVIGGVIGALIWAMLAHYTNYESSAVALGVGLLAGVGVMIGSGRTGGVLLGVVGAANALAAVLLAKWMWVSFAVSVPLDNDFMVSATADIIIEERAEANLPVRRISDAEFRTNRSYPPDVWNEAQQRWSSFTTDEREKFRSAPALLNPQLHLVLLADAVCHEYMDQGRVIEWPPGYDLDSAWRKGHYPPAIWIEAERRWSELSAAEVEQFLRSMEQREIQYHQEFLAAVQPDIFMSSFDFFDLLFAFLAATAAYGFGSLGPKEADADSEDLSDFH